MTDDNGWVVNLRYTQIPVLFFTMGYRIFILFIPFIYWNDRKNSVD